MEGYKDRGGHIRPGHMLMKRHSSKACILLILFLLMIPLLTGCNRNNPQPQPPAPQKVAGEEEQSTQKAPDQLKGIENSLEQIIKALKGPAVVQEEGKEKQDQKGADGGQGGKQQGGQQEGGGGQGEQKEQGGQGEKGGEQGKQGEETKQQPPQQQPKQPDAWEQMTPIINNLHYQWSEYMPMAARAGASRPLLDNFSNALNNLTQTIISKNTVNSLVASSQAYRFIPDFYALYKTPTSPEIKRIRHYTRNAMISSMTGNWAQAETDINSLKSSWSLFKSMLPKEQQQMSSQMDFAVSELEKVVQAKNQPLTDIKGRVLMSNIQAVEKAMEKDGKGGGQ